ncbi:hypothetical protein [Chitinophaga sancti]|uniref:Uncharacterized protein n=1 Tax=Chitinophaga sancti TaxID=1004 RepID=A0A1K1LPP8_9BACT|nr:hypothetical protein [Chitinophaga sancti]WQD64947.1 hypothetical protein U0033_11130 [Chitinophaga sancti]WQG89429.1 hypothetical protein SR876_31340 [Chitinophaga sancti]SFW12877.1 hypothetical protein SAMN05661012_00114 [Chitinophaga sancti]
MSNKQRELVDALRKLVHTDTVIIPAVVDDVDEAAGSIVALTATGLKISDVRLRAVIGDNDGVLVFPQKKSSVLIARIQQSNYFVVISMEKVDKIQYFVEDRLFEMDKDGLKVSAGEESLKKCLDDLLDEIVTIYAPMNKSAFTDIKDRIAKILK